MKTEQLLSQLSQDLKPVKRITLNAIFFSGGGLLLTYAGLLMLTVFPPRADIADIFWSRFHGLAFLPVAMALLALRLGSRETASAAGRRSISRFVLWAGFVAYCAFCYWYSWRISDLPALVWSAIDLKCMALIGLTSLPVWIFAAMAAAYILPVSRKYEFAAAFAAGSVGALVVNFHCPYDGHGHHLFGHALFPFLLGSLSFLPLTYACRRLTRSMVERRTKATLRRIS